jgi:hypothetical protein
MTGELIQLVQYVHVHTYRSRISFGRRLDHNHIAVIFDSLLWYVAKIQLTALVYPESFGAMVVICRDDNESLHHMSVRDIHQRCLIIRIISVILRL